MKVIIFKIDTAGKVQIEAKNYTGIECTEATKDFIQALGKKQTEILKEEYFETQSQKELEN